MAKSSGMRRVGRWLFWGLGSLMLISVLILLIFRFVPPPTSAFMVAYQLEHDRRPVRHSWVDLDQMSRWLPLAVVASEDQRFLQHWGLDLDAIATAVDDYRQGDSLRGASTLSQQTAKNLFLWNGRQFIRKVLEAGLTLEMEALWNKRRIIEVYLNFAEFGPGIYGVEAASRAFFGLPASQLNRWQAARLAAVLPNPRVLDAAHPSAYLRQRINWITRQMRQLGGVAYLASIYHRCPVWSFDCTP